MDKVDTQFPEMSLEQLFASARALGSMPEMASMTVNFYLTGCNMERGTLTISRNPTSTRWLTTLGIAQGDRYHARIAQGMSANEALNKIENYCQWWLGE
jgi:hypothetical protein